MVSADRAGGEAGSQPGETGRPDTMVCCDDAFQLLNDMGDAVFVHDHQGRMWAFNEAACTSLGYTRAELSRLSLTDIETLLSREQVAAACAQMKAHAKPMNHTGVHRRKDRTLVPVEMRSTAIVRDGRDLILTVARDVSAHHQAEQILRDSERSLRSLIEQSPFGIAVTLSGGRVLMANGRLAELLGRERAVLQTMNVHEIHVYPEDVARMLELYAFRGRVLDREVRLLALDPETGVEASRWFLVSWQPIRFEGQDAIVSWYQDINHRHAAGEEMRDLHAELQFRIEERTRELGVEITERRYAEAALKEANEFLEQKVEERTSHLMREIDQRRRAEKEREKTEMELLDIIETAPIAVGIADPHGRFLFWNPLFFKLGRQRAEANGKISFGLDFAEADLMPELQARVFKGEAVEHVEARLFTNDEDARWVLVSMRRLTFEGQAAILTWVFDVTDMKEQAEALEEARRAAEESVRAKSAFLATMSHEIRTPMNGVVTMAEMMAQTRLDRDQRHMLDVVIESAGALLSIIDEILDFSKIEAGRVTLEDVSLSLTQLTERVADLLAPKAEQKGLDLLCWSTPGIPDHFGGDANRLRQILVNLAGNAIKFTARGHVAITVGLVDAPDVPNPGPEAARWIRFEVRDTGIGMTDEQVSRLFQPFSQADNSTQRRFGGTGLGLSISRTLVEVMGGRIGVDSMPGEGSVFWFELLMTPRSERRNLEPPPINGARVLMIGDSDSMRERVGATLTWGGAEAVQARDMDAAKAALMHALVRERPFDAAILDRRIGSQPGSHHIGDVLRLGGTPTLPVLVMVPRGSPESSRVADRKGVMGVVGWPVHRFELAYALSVALGRTAPDELSPWRRRSSDRPVGDGVGHYAAPDRATAEAAGCLILVAEDHPTNQTVIRMLMNRLGLVADLAGNGREALALFETRSYGLVVTDCHMPEMDGYELTERIRARETETGAGRRTPIVALTADAISGTAQYCLDRGMDGYLTKPVAVVGLEAAVGKWLPKALDLRTPKPGGSTPPPPPPPPPPDSSAEAVEAAVTDDLEKRLDGAADEPEPVLDTRYLLDLVGGDEAILKGLLKEFVDSVAYDVAVTVEALSEGRMDAAQKAAHAVSGAARSAGALRLGGLCQRIEGALLQGDTDMPLQLKGAIQPAFDEVEAVVRAL